MKAMTYLDVSDRDDFVAKVMNDSQWVVQQKLDGARVLAHLGFPEGSGPIFRQRDDQPMKFAAVAQHLRAIHEALPVFDHPVILDGEVIPSTGTYHIWDIIDPSKPDLPYALRLADLYNLDIDSYRARTVSTAMDLGPKTAMFERVRDAGAEGVMVKDVGGIYQPGQRVSHAVKVKFTRTAEVIVLEVTRPDARHGSATLGAYLPGTTTLVGVGACSLIGKPQVQPGDVVEIRYLYWTGTNVYQPRLTKPRPDKPALDCTMAQFKAYTREVFV